MIAHLGLERFGVWSIAGSLITSLRALDLGLGVGVSKFVAEATGQNDLKRANLMFWSGAVLSMFFMTIISLAFLGSRSYFLARILRVGPDLYQEANLAFALGAAALWSSAASKTVGRLLDGLQRMDLNNAIQTLSSIGTVLGMWAMLQLNRGLPALIAVNLATSILATIAIMVLANRYLPTLRFNPGELKLAEVRVILRYSLIVQVGSLATLMLDPLMKILIGSFLSTGFVGIYEASQRAASVLRQFMASGLAALLPASARLESIRSEAARRLYISLNRYVGIIATPATLTIILFAQIFATLWIGDELASAVGWSIRGLALAGWLGTMATIAFYIAQGAGHEKLSTVTMLLNLIGLAVVTPPAIMQWGYLEAVGTYVFSVLLAWAYLTWAFNNLIGVNLRVQLWRPILRPLLWNIPMFALAAWLIKVSTTNWNWPRLGIASLAYFIFATMVSVKGADLTEAERDLITRSLSSFVSKAAELLRLIRVRLRGYYFSK